MTVHTLVQPFWPHLAVRGSRARTVCASYRQAIDGELFKFRCMLLQTKPIQERGYVSYGHPFDAAQLNGVETVSGGMSSRYSSSKGEACFRTQRCPALLMRKLLAVPPARARVPASALQPSALRRSSPSFSSERERERGPSASSPSSAPALAPGRAAA